MYQCTVYSVAVYQCTVYSVPVLKSAASGDITFTAQPLILFQLNTHMLNTCIYHQLAPTCFGVCYSIFRETIALLAEKTECLL